MSMRLYATVAQDFTDDADFVDTQAVPKDRVFLVREPTTLRLQAVAVDANGALVAAAGSATATVLEAVPRKETGDPDQPSRNPYVALTGVSGTLNVGTSLSLAVQPGEYAIRFTSGASFPMGATNVRIFLAGA